jgi:hypothetical protein
VGEAEKGRWGKELGHLCINSTRVTTSPDPNEIEIVENVHPTAHTGLECVGIRWNVQGAARLLNRGKMMLAPHKSILRRLILRRLQNPWRISDP